MKFIALKSQKSGEISHSASKDHILFLFIYLFLLFFFFLSATHKAYGSFQAWVQIGATAAGLSYSHSNKGSKLHLQPTPQLTAMLDPQPTERGHGSTRILIDASQIHFR